MRFIGLKLAGAVGTMLALATVVFFLLKIAPGDEATTVAGPGASQQQIEATRRELGLDRSIFVQYLSFLGRLVHGDLGVSSVTHLPVAQSLMAVLPATAELVIATLVIGVSVSIPLAALSAFKTTGVSDSLRRVLVIFAAGMPTFWLALMVQLVVASNMRLLPISGRLSEGIDVPVRTGSMVIDALLAGNPLAAGDAIQHLILPACVLAVPFGGLLYRLVRSELLRVLQRDHVLVARAAGVPRGRLVRRHVVPQALTPAIIWIGVAFGTLFGEAILVESVFARTGIGSLMTTAIQGKDTLTVEGGVLAIGLIVVLSNFTADIVQMARDPRIRSGSKV